MKPIYESVENFLRLLPYLPERDLRIVYEEIKVLLKEDNNAKLDA